MVLGTAVIACLTEKELTRNTPSHTTVGTQLTGCKNFWSINLFNHIT